jgi:SAM-dependent methyltransferase
MSRYTSITGCRACGSKELTPLFSLGDQYVSNFVTAADMGQIKLAATVAKAGVATAATEKINALFPKVPIDIELCRDCTLVQAKHSASLDKLYRERYWYRSGVTATMRDALKNVVEAAVANVDDLVYGDVVLDIGSNDGTLLRYYDEVRIDEFGTKVAKVGVEPAKNLAVEGARGVDIFISDFWSAEAYFKGSGAMRGPTRKAKIITACGMFYDMEDPNAFIADVAKVLAPGGVFVAQLMCLRNMLNVGDVGNLAHEHLEFYSLRSLMLLFEKYGLEIFDLETNSVNGESYRLYIGHKNDHVPTFGALARFQDAWNAEKHLSDPATFERFYRGMDLNRLRCREFLLRAKSHGKRTWILGASTKGSVICQWYGLDASLIEAAADRSPEKHGLYTVGTGIPIKSEEAFRAAKPDFALILPYTFRQEIMERERAHRDHGGKFIVPIPVFEVL